MKHIVYALVMLAAASPAATALTVPADSLPEKQLSLKNSNAEEIRHSQLSDSQKIIYFGNSDMAPSDSADSLLERFYYDQYRHFQDAGAILPAHEQRCQTGHGRGRMRQDARLVRL